MPNLIVDDAAIKLAMKKLSGSPIYMGPDGKMVDPGIVDLLNQRGGNPWSPGDDRTKLLVLAGDACKDILLITDLFVSPQTRQRALKNLVTPLCTLMDKVGQLLPLFHNDQSRGERAEWPQFDQRSYLDIGKHFNKKRFGPVRLYRNKAGAHADKEVFDQNAPRLNAKEVLGALGDSLLLLHLMLRHETAGVWIRFMGATVDGKYDIVQQMVAYPTCITFLVNREGHVEDVYPLQLAADPLGIIQEPVEAAMVAYNEMNIELGKKLPEIMFRQTEELHRAESKHNKE